MSLKAKVTRFLDKLSELFNEQNGPFNPAPDVRAKLEEKGYNYREVLVMYPGVPASSYEITSPEGKRLDTIFAKKAALQQYYQDYDRAVQECRPAQPQPK